MFGGSYGYANSCIQITNKKIVKVDLFSGCW